MHGLTVMVKLPHAVARNYNRLKDLNLEDVRKFVVGPKAVEGNGTPSRWREVGQFFVEHPTEPAIVVTIPPELGSGWMCSLRMHVLFRLRRAEVVYRFRQQLLGDGMLVVWVQPDPQRTLGRQRVQRKRKRAMRFV